MKIRVRYLGSLSLLLGRDDEIIELDLEEITLRDFLIQLVKRSEQISRAIDPRGRVRPGYLLFINEIDYQILGLDYLLRDGDEIIIMPISHGGEEKILRLIKLFNDLYDRCEIYYYKIDSWDKSLWKEISDLIRGREVYFQIFREDRVPTKRILIYALSRAMKAFSENKNVSRDLGIEILLRILDTRDIKTAIKKLGAEEGERAVLTIISCSKDLEKDLFNEIDKKFSKYVFSKEDMASCLGSLAKTLDLDINECLGYNELDKRIYCLEIAILNKISVSE